jgi:hypothetical protein
MAEKSLRSSQLAAMLLKLARSIAIRNEYNLAITGPNSYGTRRHTLLSLNLSCALCGTADSVDKYHFTVVEKVCTRRITRS